MNPRYCKFYFKLLSQLSEVDLICCSELGFICDECEHCVSASDILLT